MSELSGGVRVHYVFSCFVACWPGYVRGALRPTAYLQLASAPTLSDRYVCQLFSPRWRRRVIGDFPPPWVRNSDWLGAVAATSYGRGVFEQYGGVRVHFVCSSCVACGPGHVPGALRPTAYLQSASAPSQFQAQAER